MQPDPAQRAGVVGRAAVRRADGATWGITVGLGVPAAVATLLANLFIVRGFPDAARPDDLLFELLPYLQPARWLTLVALVLGFGVFLTDLTPLASAQGDERFLFTPQLYGMFPSGHTAAITLLLLLTPPERTLARRAQWVALAPLTGRHRR